MPIIDKHADYVYRVVKDLHEWKEAPLDCVILSLYQLQAFYSNEIKRGLAGLGEYTICQQYSPLKQDESDVEYLPACSPNEIVKMIRDGKVEEQHDMISEVISYLIACMVLTYCMGNNSNGVPFYLLEPIGSTYINLLTCYLPML